MNYRNDEINDLTTSDIYKIKINNNDGSTKTLSITRKELIAIKNILRDK